ncbi:MAG TPA: VWA domain-containing protein [Pyrinomonadaceae bacterium]|nr:VWA domain-containing protein [Pyrinomonadaceae bacterium]
MRTVVYLSLLSVAALALCGVAAVPAPPASAQTQQGSPAPTPPANAQGQDDTERVTARIVRLPISVVDKKDQPVAGLTRHDFQIFEDKVPQQIDFFLDERERQPVYVAVLMDTSSSTAGKLKFEQEAAMNFIHTVIRLRKDKVAFAAFDDEVRLLQDFTDKLDLLDRAVHSVKKPGSHTSLYDAVWLVCEEKMRNIGSGRRVVVVISDGDDTYSRARLDDAIDIAQRTETTIFAISTKAGLSGAVPGVEVGQVRDQGDKNLVRLCEKTGGKAFFTGDFLELERSFTKIAKELRAQYFVTYRPTNNVYDGKFRKIEVKLAGRSDGLRVRAREGYKAVQDTVQ